MSEDAIRFAIVGDDPECRSWEWRIHVHNGEIYARPRYGRQHLRASLHSSGHCHIAIRNVPENGDSQRFTQFRLPAEMSPGLSRVFAILFPEAASTFQMGNEPDAKCTLIPAAPSGSAVEVNLFIRDLSRPDTGWPGQRAMGTQLLGRLPRDERTELIVVWGYTPDEGVEKRAAQVEEIFAKRLDVEALVHHQVAQLDSAAGLRLRLILSGVSHVDDQDVAHFTEIAVVAHRKRTDTAEGRAGAEIVPALSRLPPPC